METKHTKGPWRRAGKFATHILSADGKMVADAPHHHEMPTDEGYANALLIAAAPDLLQILVDVLDKWKCDADPDECWELVNNAEAAIRKATHQD